MAEWPERVDPVTLDATKPGVRRASCIRHRELRDQKLNRGPMKYSLAPSAKVTVPARPQF